VRRGTAFTSPEVTQQFLRLKLAELEHEMFALLLLDTPHRLIEYVELFRGSLRPPLRGLRGADCRVNTQHEQSASATGVESSMDLYSQTYALTSVSTMPPGVLLNPSAANAQ
jgi:hypothetical protein